MPAFLWLLISPLTYPGVIRATVQVSEDQRRVLSHVLWQSRLDCEKAVENAAQGEGDLWAMVRDHRATAMIFNAYQLVGETVGPGQAGRCHVRPGDRE